MNRYSLLSIIVAFGLLSCVRAEFIDDFNRSDSNEIGNGWTKSGDIDDLDPRIVLNEIRWVNISTDENRVTSKIERIYEVCSTISADMRKANYGGGDSFDFCFTVEDMNGNHIKLVLDHQDTIDPNMLIVRILVNDIWQHDSSVARPSDYHNYKIHINDQGKVTVYFDGQEKWASVDGVIGKSVYASFSASRQWPYHEFHIDNFSADNSPATCEERIAQGGGMQSDLNRDCAIDLEDLAIFTEEWLENNDPVNYYYSPKLYDGVTTTGVSVYQYDYIVQRPSIDEPLVKAELFINSLNDGTVTIKCGDVYSVPLYYGPGQYWYEVRIPFGTARNVEIHWNNPGYGVYWDELRLVNRTPVSTDWPVDAIEINLNISLGGVGSAPCVSYPFAIGAMWYPRSIVDGITNPQAKQELIQELQYAGISALRYPGGMCAHAYPLTEESIPAWEAAGLHGFAWGLTDMDYYGHGWASPKDYFSFCRDAGITAWYQLATTHWYDDVNDVVVKIHPWDSPWQASPETGDYDYIEELVADAVELAQYADQIGVDVVWEIGNEDYCFYTPDTYADICEAYIKAIRAISPGARFSVCSDGYDWGDWSFRTDFATELSTRGVGRIHYSSSHLYEQNVPQTDTPTKTMYYLATCWRDPGYFWSLFHWVSDLYDDAGLGPTEFDLTELNVSTIDWAQEIEHSAGRAIGEAAGNIQKYQDGASIFYWDLSRNGDGPCWGERLDYFPQNAAGKRYNWFGQGQTAGIVSKHGNGNIIYNSNGVCVSKQSDRAYVTVINMDSWCKEVNLQLQGVTEDPTREPEYVSYRAASPDCYFFDYHIDTGELTGQSNSLAIKSYPYSVTGVTVYLR